MKEFFLVLLLIVARVAAFYMEHEEYEIEPDEITIQTARKNKRWDR